jgi:stalled ribosome rescue protein Dom34
MNNYVVWMDSKNARIFALKSTGIEKSVLRKSDKDHHTRNKHDKKIDANAEHYYRDLAARLKGADQLLLMGPGLAKADFKSHLTTHQANTLAKKIIGLEDFQSDEHKTEKQMMAQAKKFFKEYEHFDNLL